MKKLCVRQKITSAQGYRSAVFCAVRKGAIADKEQTGYLKKLSERFDGELVYLTLVVPNTEVKPEYNFRLVQPEYKEKRFFCFVQWVRVPHISLLRHILFQKNVQGYGRISIIG